MTSASSNALVGSSPSRSASLSASGPSQMPSGSSATSSGTADAIDPAARDLARKLHAFERSLDAAFAAGGELASAAVRARTAHRLSATVGHSIFDAIGEANHAVIAARGQAVRGHKLLEQLARSLDLPVTSYGDERKDQGDGTGKTTGLAGA